ncbi:MAG: hypothetical protein GX128_04755 [Bacteroidales bacterium]|jgi:hypothetical protein|nr:hypothetical protein [Bacteroidales bacterium]
MKQTFTLYPTFSEIFSTKNASEASAQQGENENNAPCWVLNNILAYSAALFVVKTKNIGNYYLILN